MPSHETSRTGHERRRVNRRRANANRRILRNVRILLLYITGLTLPVFLTVALTGSDRTLVITFAVAFVFLTTLTLVAFVCCGRNRKWPRWCCCFHPDTVGPAHGTGEGNIEYDEEAPPYESLGFGSVARLQGLPGMSSPPPPEYDEIQVEPPTYDQSFDIPNIPIGSGIPTT